MRASLKIPLAAQTGVSGPFFDKPGDRRAFVADLGKATGLLRADEAEFAETFLRLMEVIR